MAIATTQLRKLTATFESKQLNRQILRISLPVTLAMITHTAIMVSDSIMVGRLGQEALAAASLGGSVFWTWIAFFMGLSIGLQIIVARRHGEQRYSAAGQAFVSMLYPVFVLGLAATAFGYAIADVLVALLSYERDFSSQAIEFVELRLLAVTPYFLMFALRSFFDGIGRTEIGFFSAVLTMITNIFLNWVLIYGNLDQPALGTNGAAIASGLATIPGLLLGFWFLLRPEFRAHFQGVSARPDISGVREVMYLGFAPGLDNLLMNVSFLLFYMLAGVISTTAVAASGVIVSVLSIAFMPGFGFSIAATTILGQAVATGHVIRARLATNRSVLYAALLMGSMGIGFLIFASPLLSAFSDDPAVIAAAIPALYVISIVQAADGAQMVWAAALRSAGLVYWVLWVYLGLSFLLMLPMAYLLGVHLGLGTMGLWMGILSWLLALAAVFGLKFRTRDWENIAI